MSQATHSRKDVTSAGLLAIGLVDAEALRGRAQARLVDLNGCIICDTDTVERIILSRHSPDHGVCVLRAVRPAADKNSETSDAFGIPIGTITWWRGCPHQATADPTFSLIALLASKTLGRYGG
mmetsp:Transcript_123023/g.359098  ORF Transcript_123023/g.359098 Transcript_123023/m.359098 type:complete len:123 (+) Transcript_123023:864-1232(+)